MNAPLLSVIICTHNRADYLAEALHSVIGQEFPRDDYEVVVVDNASTDHTPAVAAAFEPVGNVRYVHEPMLGLNIARNTGWRSAAGRYAVYFDDDAIAEPGWLAAVRDGFATTGGSVVLGGPVEPIWEAEQPAWLSADAAVALTIVDWGSEPRPLAEVPREWLAGANFALPVELLNELGGFEPSLERYGKHLLSNGDIFIQRLAQRHGYPCYYSPAMRIRHRVPAARLTQRWFVSRYYWQGVSDAVMEVVERAPNRAGRLFAVLRRAGRLMVSPRSLSALLLPTRDPGAFTRKCLALIEVGHVAGLLGIARR